jgi:hypothetical protein
MKLKLTLLLVMIYSAVHSQSMKILLNTIETENDLAQIKKRDSRWVNAKFVTSRSNNDTTETGKMLLAAEKGSTHEIDGMLLKVVDKEEGPAHKVSYIYLDGSKMALSEINKKREEILGEYSKGTAFIDLVHKYTMDGNPTGDLDWFFPKSMVSEFSEEVGKYKKDDVFTVDVPGKKWYYVVLKTHDDIILTSVKVLIVEPWYSPNSLPQQ